MQFSHLDVCKMLTKESKINIFGWFSLHFSAPCIKSRLVSMQTDEVFVSEVLLPSWQGCCTT